MSEFTQNVILKKMRNARISFTEYEQENHFLLKQKPKYGKAMTITLK